jgi:hypothetical protein
MNGMRIKIGAIIGNMEFGLKKLRQSGQIKNPWNFLIPTIALTNAGIYGLGFRAG